MFFQIISNVIFFVLSISVRFYALGGRVVLDFYYPCFNEILKIIFQEQAQAQGWAKAGKLEGRATAQGFIGIQVKDNAAVMVELNCETDFVARNKEFLSLLQTVTDLNLTAANSSEFDGEFYMKDLEKADLDQLKQPNGNNLADLIALNIGKIGENISLKRAVHFKTSLARSRLTIVGLTHPTGT